MLGAWLVLRGQHIEALIFYYSHFVTFWRWLSQPGSNMQGAPCVNLTVSGIALVDNSTASTSPRKSLSIDSLLMYIARWLKLIYRKKKKKNNSLNLVSASAGWTEA